MHVLFSMSALNQGIIRRVQRTRGKGADWDHFGERGATQMIFRVSLSGGLKWLYMFFVFVLGHHLKSAWWTRFPT